MDELGEFGSFEEAVAEEGEVYDLLDHGLGLGVGGDGAFLFLASLVDGGFKLGHFLLVVIGELAVVGVFAQFGNLVVA